MNHRLAQFADLKSIYDIYMDKDANAYLTYDPMSIKEFEEIFIDLLASTDLYVVEKEGEVVGTYRLISKKDRQKHTWYLGGFAVKANQKGKGLGYLMLEHIKQKALEENKNRIELTVDMDNKAAVNLYKKSGFEIEGVVRKSYKLASTGEFYDEYLMSYIME